MRYLEAFLAEYGNGDTHAGTPKTEETQDPGEHGPGFLEVSGSRVPAPVKIEVPDRETSPCTALENSGGYIHKINREAWPPRDPELATWPDLWRHKWGQRANDLEAQGLAWTEAERTAFRRTKRELADFESEHGPVERVKPPDRGRAIGIPGPQLRTATRRTWT